MTHMPPKAMLTQVGEDGVVFHLDAVNTIGRDRDCSIALRDRGVSNDHARITFAAGNWVLRDADSRNGTTLNGYRIRQAVLTDGDRLAFGDTQFVFNAAPPWSSATGPVVRPDEAELDGVAEPTIWIDARPPSRVQRTALVGASVGANIVAGFLFLSQSRAAPVVLTCGLSAMLVAALPRAGVFTDRAVIAALTVVSTALLVLLGIVAGLLPA